MASSLHSPFVDLPLDRSKRSIRLFQFLQTELNGTIYLKLQIFDQADRLLPEYNALSYAWGDLEHIEFVDIRVNDGNIRISPNLHDFLRVLRNHGSQKWYWADQISLNQNNVEERDHQVQLMGGIYSRALNVDVWLGHGLNCPVHLGLTDELNVGLPESLWMATADYWSRLWIVQELLLARRIRVCWRKESLRTVDFFARLDEVNKIEPATLMTWRHEDVSRRLRLYHKEYRTTIRRLLNHTLSGQIPDPGRRDLATILLHYGQKNCADPRDKVFGLQSLVRRSQRIDADYSKGLHEMARTTFWHVLVLGPPGENLCNRWSLVTPGDTDRDMLFQCLRWTADTFNVHGSELKRLAWAYMVPRIPLDLRLMASALSSRILGQEVMLAHWDQICKMIIMLATTPKQELIAQEFFAASNIPDEWMKAHLSGPQDIDSWCRNMQMGLKDWEEPRPICPNVLEDRADATAWLIADAGTRHGFFMCGQCLRHPDEPWLFPTGAPSTLNDYFVYKGKKM